MPFISQPERRLTARVSTTGRVKQHPLVMYFSIVWMSSSTSICELPWWWNVAWSDRCLKFLVGNLPFSSLLKLQQLGYLQFSVSMLLPQVVILPCQLFKFLFKPVNGLFWLLWFESHVLMGLSPDFSELLFVEINLVRVVDVLLQSLLYSWFHLLHLNYHLLLQFLHYSQSLSEVFHLSSQFRLGLLLLLKLVNEFTRLNLQTWKLPRGLFELPNVLLTRLPCRS